MLSINIEDGDKFVIGDGFIWLRHDNINGVDIYLDLQEMDPLKRKPIQKLKGRLENLASELAGLVQDQKLMPDASAVPCVLPTERQRTRKTNL